MALGAMIFAGADGIARELTLPETEAPLPTSLSAALDLMDASDAMKSWFGSVFFEAYMRHKRSEAAYVADLPEEELCALYAEVY
jgi:glutamine synthetase